MRRTLRQPALIVPTIVFPLFLLAVNSSGLSAATNIPGFPADSYLDFAITVTLHPGRDVRRDHRGHRARDRHRDRLPRTACSSRRCGGVAILVGQMAGATTLALLGAVTYLAVGLIAGVDIKSGVGGRGRAPRSTRCSSPSRSRAIGAALGARTGSAEAVQGVFPLLFALFFLSSMSLPRDLIAVDWFRTVATWNPVSYLIEGMRSLVITGWDGTALWRGLAVGVGDRCVLSFWAASQRPARRGWRGHDARLHAASPGPSCGAT